MTGRDSPDGTGLDLVGGRVFDPGQEIDRAATVSIDAGLISSVRDEIDTRDAADTRAGAPPERQEIDVSGLLVTPGLVDLHTHLYPGVSHYGIDPDLHCLGRGVTTAVDAGSAGAQTFPGMRRYVIERCSTRILAFLNIAVEGMISVLVGELEDIRWASPEEAVARARENPDLIMGIKVRLGYQMVGDDPQPAVTLALKAADELGLPLMVHVIDMRPGLAWLLPRLRGGDIVTHCFHGNEGGIIGEDGRMLPEAIAARERGVLFDIGHGIGSFAYEVARNAIAQGFAPDTISSDLHSHNCDGPVFDQATTLSKLLHVGMELDDVIKATTSTPAYAIGKAQTLGAIAAGRQADLSVLELRTGHWALPDAAGQTEVVERLLVPRTVIRAGQVRAIEPAASGLSAAEVHR
ncbi:MAG: amidohydrolase/deacetylase family metallohydrolase [Nocardiopsaceae bacterium]|nr:amidohydrolase/deacetylase family metallohydrolase [Nocardiopsaceae bacterium]